jgi:hypothetical protein
MRSSSAVRPRAGARAGGAPMRSQHPAPQPEEERRARGHRDPRGERRARQPHARQTERTGDQREDQRDVEQVGEPTQQQGDARVAGRAQRGRQRHEGRERRIEGEQPADVAGRLVERAGLEPEHPGQFAREERAEQRGAGGQRHADLQRGAGQQRGLAALARSPGARDQRRGSPGHGDEHRLEREEDALADRRCRQRDRTQLPDRHRRHRGDRRLQQVAQDRGPGERPDFPPAAPGTRRHARRSRSRARCARPGPRAWPRRRRSRPRACRAGSRARRA